jgi:phage-related protein
MNEVKWGIPYATVEPSLLRRYSMSLMQQTILEKLQKLPPEKQGEVLEFIESLQQETEAKSHHPTLRGIWAEVEEITEEDIAEVRREMWRNFPRDIE